MTPPPSDPDPNSTDDDSDDLGGADLPESSASDPEEARKAAEDALAQVEALAGLDAASLGDEDRNTGEASGASGSETSSEDPREEGPLQDQCGNCGALLDGPYCSQCGQKAADRIVPIWHMVNEIFEAVFELDVRVLHTLPKFLFKPGRLTKEYINGRRKRYIRPFRLYLFTTFLLFTVLALTTGGSFRFPFDPGMSPSRPDTTQAVTAGVAGATGSSADTIAASDTGAGFFGDPEQREEIARRIEQDTSAISVDFGTPETSRQIERILRTNLPQAIRDPGEFVESMIDQGPYVMFFMLPLFAAVLKLLYIRRGRLYVEHLVFSLHVHAFAFVAFSVGILLGESSNGWANTAGTWIELTPLLYLVVALRHVYEQGIIKSTIKASILLFIYTFILTFGFLGLLLAAILFI